MAHSRTLSSVDTVLLVIDVQERINPVMAGQGHVPRIGLLLDAAVELGLPSVTTEQYPRGLGATVAELAAKLPATAIEKSTFSCAREPAALAALEATGRNHVLVVGIEAHVCVLQTVLDLLRRGFDVHVPHDAVQSRRQADRDWALRRMAAAGAVVSSTESALFELLERCDTAQFKTLAKLLKAIPVNG